MLKQIAICGGLVALGGAGYFTMKIQSKISSEEYHKKSMSMLRQYKPAVDALGQPIKARWVDLRDTETNNLDGLNSRLAIPLRGPKDKGTLYMWASREKPGLSWDINKLDLEIRSSGQRWTFYENPATKS